MDSVDKRREKGSGNLACFRVNGVLHACVEKRCDRSCLVLIPPTYACVIDLTPYMQYRYCDDPSPHLTHPVCEGGIYICLYLYLPLDICFYLYLPLYGLAKISRLHRIIGLFCKRAL